MNKEDIQKDDLIEFANGKKTIIGEKSIWILDKYYNEDLTCIKNSDYDIIRIYRPTYEEIFERNLPTR